jgi:hypothetical protein
MRQKMIVKMKMKKKILFLLLERNLLQKKKVNLLQQKKKIKKMRSLRKNPSGITLEIFLKKRKKSPW